MSTWQPGSWLLALFTRRLQLQPDAEPESLRSGSGPTLGLTVSCSRSRSAENSRQQPASKVATRVTGSGSQGNDSGRRTPGGKDPGQPG